MRTVRYNYTVREEIHREASAKKRNKCSLLADLVEHCTDEVSS